MERIFKCFYVILLLIFVGMLSNKIYAKDIEIHAKSENENKNVTFDIWTGAYEENFEKGKAYYIDNKVNGPHQYLKYYKKMSEGMDENSGFKFTTGTVKTFSYLIHNKELTNYSDSQGKFTGNMWGDYGYTTSFNSKKNFINIVNEKSDGNIKYLEFARITQGYTYIEINPKVHVTLDHEMLPRAYLDEIKKNLGSLNPTTSENNYMLYISNPLIWYRADRIENAYEQELREIYDVNIVNKENGEIDYELNENEKKKTEVVGLKTAAAVNAIDRKYNYNGGRLTTMFGLTGLDSGLNSFLNYYDNKLFIPKNVIGVNSKVYVRHVDKNGNILDSNDDEILISNGNKSVKNNMTIPDGDKAKGIFSEYYEINSGETLDVSRLLNLVKDGEYYELEGVKTSTANTYDDALKNEKNAIEQNLDKVSVSAGDNSQVTVITFRYNKKSANPEPDPKGGMDTLEAGNTGEDCQMSYTPTNSNIKPYLVANKVKFLNLKYEYVIENNEVKYNSIIFNVNKLISGNFGDNDDVKYKDNVGKIFGNSEDKETLLDGNSPQTFTVSNNIDEDLNDIRRVGTLPTSSELKKIADKKTNKDDSSTYYKVPSNRYNGLRIPKITANYQEYNILNSNTGEVKSTDVNNTVKVLVYNPIKVGEISVKSEGVVDHSTGEKNNTVIQKNANFELNIGEVSGEPYVGHTYNEYLDKYYLIFDISIIKTDKTDYANLYQVSGNELRTINVGNNGEIPRGTIIELKKEQKTFYGKAGQTNTSDKISQNASQITLIGSSNNMPSDWLKSYVLRYEKNNLLNSEMVKNYISNETNSTYKLGTDINGSSTNVKLDYCDGNIDYTKYKVHDSLAYDGKDMYGDAYYFAKSTTSITNIGRIYDFKITDCSDIDYKKVFRITTGNKVNFLTGVEYFSGIKKFSIFSSDVNTLEDREEVKSVSSSSKTILPLGPYKNTDSSYVNAPKMGYRVSFDLKTSGYYNYTESNAKNSKRVIKITPSYYYISKDGQTYKSNIDLYYKNSDGKYVKFVGSDYTIYFKPKDGYRTKSNSLITSQNKFMSEQLEPLKIGSSEGFTLDYKMMNTSNDNFIQSWYGEFKLPNSTIATENGNVSKPLTDGYVGVKFNIECIDTDSSSKVKTISYNTNNKNANPDTNTSQWDYEGYLGFSSPGSAAGDISIQLEKGTWTVNDNNSGSKAKYTDIKGTVALFDLDNRAANDFD